MFSLLGPELRVKSSQATNFKPKLIHFAGQCCFERESDLDVKWDNENVGSSNLFSIKLSSSFILSSDCLLD